MSLYLSGWKKSAMVWATTKTSSASWGVLSSLGGNGELRSNELRLRDHASREKGTIKGYVRIEHASAPAGQPGISAAVVANSRDAKPDSGAGVDELHRIETGGA
ncbi:Neurexin-1 [Trichinella spiralis]|uniref:Neurexin-1 n=1 Tax=Trichinella spiralis TaxID=6334 RepID=A0ABR3KD57_TRISP